MTALEREKRDENKRKVKGQKVLHLVDIGRIPHNKSYFCIRETASGYYVQSFETIVLYISKKDGSLTRCWDGWSRGTMAHMNYGLWWIRTNTKTVPALKRLSGDRYFRLPYRWAGMIAA